MVVSADVLGQPMGPIFKGQAVQEEITALPLKMGPIGCPKTSATNCHSVLCKIPKEARHRFTSQKDWNLCN